MKSRKELRRDFDMAMMSHMVAQKALMLAPDLDAAIDRLNVCYERMNDAAEALMAPPADSSLRAENV